jgi:hypothetical protein
VSEFAGGVCKLRAALELQGREIQIVVCDTNRSDGVALEVDDVSRYGRQRKAIT